MVLISLKLTDDGFLFETTASAKVDDLIESVVEIHNARLRSRLVSDAVRGLAMHGVMKENAGSDEVREITGREVERGQHCMEDPSGMRTGYPPDADAAKALKREVQSLEEHIDKDQVQKKIAMTAAGIEEKIDSIRSAVLEAYPNGLPEWDVARIALDDPIKKLGKYLGGSLVDASDACLWTCNKEFPRGKLVSDRLGSCNEKTKVIAKLTTKGAGAPTREAIVSEAERNAMTEYYFKRQEDLKKLSEADDDDFLNSAWADPKGMKRGLQGLNDVTVFR